MARFFVSYSRSVKEEVGKVVALLRAAGHEVWWDGDIPIMADWWRTILEHIEWCEVCIFVASEKSVVSTYCLAELKYASDRQRPILPFMLDDSATLSLPPEVPSRNQWLIYNGDPANMLGQINEAYANIDWQLHKDLNVRRPPEPAKGGKSLAKQFQDARRLANEQKLEEAKRHFRDVRMLDYDEWGADCDQWIARLTSYAGIVDLIDDETTLSRARQEWISYVREHGDSFDPCNIKQKLRGMRSNRAFPIRLMLGFTLLAIFVIVGVLIRQVIFPEMPTPTVDANSSSFETMTAISLLPSETLPISPALATNIAPGATTPSSDTPQPTNTVDIVEQVAGETATSRAATVGSERAANTTLTATFFLRTATRQAEDAVYTRAAQLLSTLETWTPIPTFTPTLTMTPTTDASLQSRRDAYNAARADNNAYLSSVIRLVFIGLLCFLLISVLLGMISSLSSGSSRGRRYSPLMFAFFSIVCVALLISLYPTFSLDWCIYFHSGLLGSTCPP